MARRNLKQEAFRRKYHRQLVQRSKNRPGWRIASKPTPGSAKRAVRS